MEPNFALIAYFYLVFVVISSVIQDRFTIRKEYYLSLISLLLPLLHNYTIPSIILSLGFGMFFPFSIVLSAIIWKVFITVYI
ncbi:hypothetical protein J5U21_01544 [Saccharolobus shibatae]|uniref:Uncharacterized protein n=1 Tax=Saccharolobus shibatae TaxID=2286 RepID=A0A8F5BUT5_9CREN|nr:hypothetical protein J5U21_01544 [Saccharolobus shibatae]